MRKPRSLKRAVSSNDRSQVEDEIGDILFTVANIGRFLGVHPELALRKANRKFRRRFRFIEQSVSKTGRTLTEMSIEELEALWNEAKKGEREEG